MHLHFTYLSCLRTSESEFSEAVLEASSMASDAVMIGLDLGTTTCRCILFDLTGQTLAEAYCETPVRYPRPRWAEGDPEAWWASACAVARRALATWNGDARRIAGVCLAG